MARRGPTRRLVTLTSDVGWAYAAQMKGVLLRSLAAERVVDLTHDLPAHAVDEAAFVLEAMAEPFPPGTVHLCVVDPGVGGRRAPIAIACRDGSFLVGPDNGVLAPLAERLGVRRAVRIDPARVGPRYRVGRTFDGRDLFAPAAALLAQGTPLGRVGTPASLHRLKLPRPRAAAGEWVGEVVHVDRFGNLITNVDSSSLPRRVPRYLVKVGRRAARSLPFASSYEALGKGHLGLLPSSFGSLEVSVAQGSAARRLGARVGTKVRIRWGRASLAHRASASASQR